LGNPKDELPVPERREGLLVPPQKDQVHAVEDAGYGVNGSAFSALTTSTQSRAWR
jgi:hypothetical protein